jgi:uncharacterized protein YdeI (YjbR/CyaY-like superfamily)
VTTLFASTTADWRAWLAQNCRSEKEVWLVIHHKDSGTPSVRYHEAIEHALCYGWIDSHARRHDADSPRLRFTPRNPRSTWSRVNRQRAATVIDQAVAAPTCAGVHGSGDRPQIAERVRQGAGTTNPATANPFL